MSLQCWEHLTGWQDLTPQDDVHQCVLLPLLFFNAVVLIAREYLVKQAKIGCGPVAPVGNILSGPKVRQGQMKHQQSCHILNKARQNQTKETFLFSFHFPFQHNSRLSLPKIENDSYQQNPLFFEQNTKSTNLMCLSAFFFCGLQSYAGCQNCHLL